MLMVLISLRIDDSRPLVFFYGVILFVFLEELTNFVDNFINM